MSLRPTVVTYDNKNFKRDVDENNIIASTYSQRARGSNEPPEDTLVRSIYGRGYPVDTPSPDSETLSISTQNPLHNSSPDIVTVTVSVIQPSIATITRKIEESAHSGKSQIRIETTPSTTKSWSSTNSVTPLYYPTSPSSVDPVKESSSSWPDIKYLGSSPPVLTSSTHEVTPTMTTPVSSVQKGSLTGAIVGGVVGAFTGIICLTITIIMQRRRRRVRRNARSHVDPLIPDLNYIPPLSKRERLALEIPPTAVREQAHEDVPHRALPSHGDLERNEFQTRPDFYSRHQMEAMGQRILALEEEVRRSRLNPTLPPNYSATSLHRLGAGSL